MFRRHVLRGAKAGLVAGLVFAALVAFVGNPLIAAAEAGAGHGGDGHGAEGHGAEEHGVHDHGAGSHGGEDHATGGEHGHESVVSAAVTNAVGVASGVLWGLLLGLAFGVAYFFLEPTLPGGATARRALLAGAGFLTVSGVPWLLVPPAAPGTEAALGVDARTGLSLGGAVAGALACGLGGWLHARLADRGPSVAVPAAVAPLALVVAAAALAPLPSSAAPGPLGTAVRGFAVVGQALLWGVLAVVHGRLSGASADAAQDDPAVPDWQVAD